MALPRRARVPPPLAWGALAAPDGGQSQKPLLGETWAAVAALLGSVAGGGAGLPLEQGSGPGAGASASAPRNGVSGPAPRGPRPCPILPYGPHDPLPPSQAGGEVILILTCRRETHEHHGGGKACPPPPGHIAGPPWPAAQGHSPSSHSPRLYHLPAPLPPVRLAWDTSFPGSGPRSPLWGLRVTSCWPQGIRGPGRPPSLVPCFSPVGPGRCVTHGRCRQRSWQAGPSGAKGAKEELGPDGWRLGDEGPSTGALLSPGGGAGGLSLSASVQPLLDWCCVTLHPPRGPFLVVEASLGFQKESSLVVLLSKSCAGAAGCGSRSLSCHRHPFQGGPGRSVVCKDPALREPWEPAVSLGLEVMQDTPRRGHSPIYAFLRCRRRQ